MSVMANQSQLGSEQAARSNFDTPAAPSAATVEAFKAVMAKVGVSPDATLVAHKLAPEPIVEAATPTVEPAKVLSNPSAGLTNAEVASARVQWLAAGLDPAAFDTASGAPAPVADERTIEERTFDASPLRPATPAEYHIDLRNRGPQIPVHPALAKTKGETREATIPELARFNADIRGCMASMSMPAGVGAGLAEWASDDAKIYSGLDDVSKQLYNRQQAHDLGKMIGEDKVASAISDAKALLSIFKDTNPKLAKQFSEAGYWNSARVIATLHRQAERMYLRLEMSTKRGGTK